MYLRRISVRYVSTVYGKKRSQHHPVNGDWLLFWPFHVTFQYEVHMLLRNMFCKQGIDGIEDVVLDPLGTPFL